MHRHRHGEGGPPPREHPHQAAPPPLQHLFPRRQGVPAPADRPERGVPAPRAGPQGGARRGDVFRSVLLGAGDPGNGAGTAPPLPALLLHAAEIRLPHAAVSQLPDGEVPRRVRRPGHEGAVPPRRRRRGAIPPGGVPGTPCPLENGDECALRGDAVRGGREDPGPDRRRFEDPGAPARRPDRRGGRRRRRLASRRARGDGGGPLCAERAPLRRAPAALPVGRAGGGGDRLLPAAPLRGGCVLSRGDPPPVPRRRPRGALRRALRAGGSARRGARSPAGGAVPARGSCAPERRGRGADAPREGGGVRARGGADGGPLFAAGSAGADRGVRHLQPLGDGSGGVDGRVPRREAREEVVPEILRARGGPARTTSP